MIFNNLSDFKYHSTVEDQGLLFNPDPYHQGGVYGTDFGNGLYLSDDLDKSYAWGARSGKGKGTMNIYDIDEDKLWHLNGLILEDQPEDILLWAMITAFYLNLNLRGETTAWFELASDYYDISVDAFDWVLSRRTDDAMYRYLGEFFNDNLSFDGLMRAYWELSYGDELVLKTQSAIDCILLNEDESHTYDKYPYRNEYANFVEKGKQLYYNDIDACTPRVSGQFGFYDIAKDLRDGYDWMERVQ